MFKEYTLEGENEKKFFVVKYIDNIKVTKPVVSVQLLAQSTFIMLGNHHHYPFPELRE